MLNDIVDGISEKLNETFGHEIYTEQVKQGLTPPCFLISLINPASTRVVGPRQLRTNLFSIQYFPKSSTAARAECLDIQDGLFDALSCITVNGDLVRDTNMSGQMVDGVLIFTVNYNFYTRTVIESDPMEEFILKG